MKNRIAPVVLLSSLALSLSSSANQPAQMPLGERVQRSDYIFVAEKIATYYVDTSGRVLTPKRAQKILPYVSMEVRLRVVEVLYPPGLRPGGVAKLRMGCPGGPSETEQSLKEMLPLSRGVPKKRAIYLTRVVSPAGCEAYVVPPARDNASPWEPSSRRQVLTLIRQKIAARTP